MRQKLIPTFSSGKMKMFYGVVECSEIMVYFLEKQVEMGHDINSKEVMPSFTIEVIGSCAFGVESNSFKNPNDEFRMTGYKLFQSSLFSKYVKFAVMRAAPQLCYKIGLKFSSNVVAMFFEDLIKSTIEYRTKNGIKRPDFIQLLIELCENSKETEKPFDTDALVANTVMFFVADLIHLRHLYEMGRNPEIQEKVKEEVLRVLEKYVNKLTYEAIGEMTYFRQVIDGLTFGVMQSSIRLIQILKNFRLSVSPATKIPLTLDEKHFLLKSNETLYLKMEKI